MVINLVKAIQMKRLSLECQQYNVRRNFCHLEKQADSKPFISNHSY